MKIQCKCCLNHWHVQCKKCNPTWQSRARGWFKSRRGLWYCPVCACGQGYDPDYKTSDYSKYMCEQCMKDSGQERYPAMRDAGLAW